MNSAYSKLQEGRLSVPLILLALSLFALLLSNLEVGRAAQISGERLTNLQSGWSLLENGAVEGSDIVEISRMLKSLERPLPAVVSAARWSFALAIVSFLLFIWLGFSVRKEYLIRMSVSSEETDEASTAIARLADEIAPLAVGDLRVQATVDQTVVAPVADTINQLVSDLRWMITTMSATTRQIDLTAAQNGRMSQSIVDTTASHSESVREFSNSLSSMSGALAELSVASSEKAAMARAVSERAAFGRCAVDASISLLAEVNAGVESLEQYLTRLAGTHQAIVEQITGIQDAANRTDLFALNATIRMRSGVEIPASRSASQESGNDVRVLSDEVATMAEFLGRATREVKTLGRGISRDIAKTVEAARQISEKLENSQSAAHETAQLLGMLATDANSLENTLLGFSETTVQHSGTVRHLIENLDAINGFAYENESNLSAGRGVFKELVELSTELQNGIVEFKMPGSSDNSRKPTLAKTAARRAADRAVIHE